MMPMFAFAAFTALIATATLALAGVRMVAANKSKKPKLI
jgi:hypothetical protein